MRLKEIGKDARYKLTDREVYIIKRSKKSQSKLAEQYGVSRQRISAIQDRKGTHQKQVKRDAVKDVIRYRINPKYRAKKLLLKRTTYKKRKTFLKENYRKYG